MKHRKTTTSPEGPATIPSGLCASREKYWEEKTDAEKIESLGQAVEGLSYRVEELLEQNDLLRVHAHSEDGSIVAKLDAVSPRQPRYGHPLGNRIHTNPLRRENH
jgi:hypothetical protein